MNWRTGLVLVLLVAALVSGWSAWRQRAAPVVEAQGPMRSDYILHDFELTALSGEGSEAFTLRAPLLEQHPQDRTIRIDTPLFLLPDGEGGYWEVRSDRKSTRLNSSHVKISYAVFCLKKKKKRKQQNNKVERKHNYT